MIINLNKSILLKEFAELSISSVEGIDEQYRIEITFSKEGLIGFATNLIWMYEDIDKNKKCHIHIDPLGGKNISGNQPLGFFLTSSSPSLVISINNLSDYCDIKCENYKEINIKKEIEKSIEIKEPASYESIEGYELGCNNIADIAIYNKENYNITNKDYMQVVLKLNYDGLKDLATMLLILANNYKEDESYKLANINQKEFEYNMGIILNSNSCEAILKCKGLGCIYDYESNFGV